MELDDLKNSWNKVNSQAENQPQLTPKVIDQMTTKKINTGMRKVFYSEMGGILICLMGAVFIAFNFNKLNTWLLQGTGILSISVLLILIICSLISLHRLNKAGDVNEPHVQILKRFATQKLQFIKLQKLNVILSYLLLVSVLVLFSKLFNEKDLTNNRYFWLFSFTFGYIILTFYSKWVLGFYRKTLQEAQELLEELTSK